MGANVNWSKLDAQCGKTWSDSSRVCDAPMHWCMIEGSHTCRCRSCGLIKRKNIK